MGLFDRKKKQGQEPKNNNRAPITIYALIGDSTRVKKALTERFADMTDDVTESIVENGTESFSILLKDGTTVESQANTGNDMVGQQIPGMYNFFAQAECENRKLHESVLKQISVFNCIIGNTYELNGDESRTNRIVDRFFTAAGDINGLVLLPDMRLFSADGKLVFSMAGESDYEEYIPIGNADVIDSAAEETPDDLARKERSIALLEKKGIPFFSYLRAPVMESEARIKSPDETAKRLLAMFGVCVYCEARGGGETWDESQKYLNKIDEILGGKLGETLTPEETEFLAVKEPGQNAYGKFGWRYECCHVLMWALGKTPELGYPDQLCDVSAMGSIIWKLDSLTEFLEGANPRTKDELLDAADLILRYDWACVDARVKGVDSPAGLNEEVVVEWHYALNWLVGANGDPGWDHVTINT